MGKKINESLPKEFRLGQVGVNNQNLKMTIEVYRNNANIDVQFEDGTIIEHRTYCAFLKGEIAHPKPRLNKTKINNQGLKMTIIEDRGYRDINVQFEDGAIVEHKDYGSFLKGSIAHPIKFEESLYYLYPEIAESIAIPENNLTLEDTKTISPYSGKKFYTKCLNCSEISKNKKYLYHLTRGKKIPCNACGDGRSLPEKFLYYIFKQLNINFTTQVSPDWESLGQRSYDFYIPSLSMIIETHGAQHFKGGFSGGRTLEEEQQNDKEKKEIAIKNGIKNYIEIDCSESTLEFLKENIIRKLSPHFDLSNIDWELAWRNSQKSLKVEVKKFHDKGYNNKESAKKLGIKSQTTVINHLKAMGVKNQHERKQDNLKKILELLQLGYTKEQMAQELQVHKKTVNNYIRELKSQGLIN